MLFRQNKRIEREKTDFYWIFFIFRIIFFSLKKFFLWSTPEK